MSFPCTQCGSCCSRVGQVVWSAKKEISEGSTSEYLTEIAKFPHSWDAEGKCLHLSEKNTCKIYDQRPLICRTEEVRKKFFPEMTELEYFRIAANSCNRMIFVDGKDLKKFFVFVD